MIKTNLKRVGVQEKSVDMTRKKNRCIHFWLFGRLDRAESHQIKWIVKLNGNIHVYINLYMHTHVKKSNHKEPSIRLYGFSTMNKLLHHYEVCVYDSHLCNVSHLWESSRSKLRKFEIYSSNHIKWVECLRQITSSTYDSTFIRI